jgi:hypothetical protein
MYRVMYRWVISCMYGVVGYSYRVMLVTGWLQQQRNVGNGLVTATA